MRTVKILLLCCLSLACFFLISPRVSDLGEIEKNYAYAVCRDCKSSFNYFGKCRVCGKEVKEVGYVGDEKMFNSDEDSMPLPLVGSASEVASSLVAVVGIVSLLGAITSAVRKEGK